MKKSIFLILFFSMVCCSKKTEEQTKPIITKNVKIDNPEKKSEVEKDTVETVLEETLIDSTQIGIKGKSKLYFEKFRTDDSVYVKITLFEKNNNKWIQKQKLKLSKDGVVSCDPQIKDFNNDGFNDLTFQSSVAARGANEIRTLLIFDNIKKEFIVMKNSENYPNLEYNEVLDCIDSWMVYAGSSTVFLKIEKDSLREFAGVALFDDEREIYLVNKNGKQKIIKKETVENLEVYTRFKNYNPLIENTETE